MPTVASVPDPALDRHLTSDAFYADPYPTYARLRAEHPVYWCEPWRSWIVTRHADVMAMLHAPALYSSAGRQTPLLERLPASSQARLHPLRRIFAAGGLLNSDPPDHTRLRRLVQRAFTPRIVAGLRPSVERSVAELLEPADRSGRLEVAGELAYPLSMRVIADLLGVPPSAGPDSYPLFRDYAEALRAYFDGNGHLSADNALRVQATTLAVYDRFRALLAERRDDPRDDLLTALAGADESGDFLSEDELLATCAILFQAGHETTANLIANGLFTLLGHPEQMALLRDDPALLPAAVEEILRWVGSVPAVRRVVTEDIEVHGARLRRGQLVHLVLASANRDPEVFADPERFDVRRPTAELRHVAFGHGVHFCIGAALARLETAIALKALIARRPALRPDEPPRYHPGMLRPVLRSLIVDLLPRRAGGTDGH